MCGIFGWSLTDEGMRAGSLGSLGSALAMANELRGPDSWGIAYPGEENKVMIQKTVGLITRRIHFRMMKHHILMAHTRRKTVGAINEKNAHPWHIGDIVGAHNGMVSNYDALQKKYPEMKDYEVDSQTLIHLIAKKMDITEAHGWGTVEYFNLQEPETVYLGRGNQGDLGVAGIGTSKKTCLGVVWSSTSYDLERALRLAGFPYFMFKIKEQRLVRIVNGKLEKMGRFEFGYRSFPTPPTQTYQCGSDNSYEDPTRGGPTSRGIVSVPPSFGSLPDRASYFIPGLIWDEGIKFYVPDYASYVEYYVRKGYPVDSPLLEKERGPWRGSQRHAAAMLQLDSTSGLIKMPDKSDEDGVLTLPLAPEDHLPPERKRYMACEGCDDIKALGTSEYEDCLIYFPRLGKYFCLQCRAEWALVTGEGKKE